MKTVWVIDGAYLFNFGKAHPFDYLKLKNELVRSNGGAIYESYYLNATADPSSDTRTPSTHGSNLQSRRGQSLEFSCTG